MKSSEIEMTEIEITEIEGFRFGNAEDAEGGTGCTVIVAEEGAAAGADIRGGGPATRETDLLRPEKLIEKIHAVVLSGGSAFGLDAAGGVMEFLEMRGIGFSTHAGKVPIVCGASLFDLACGDPGARPGKDMGYAACEDAFFRDAVALFREGNHGAGTGATVGHFLGPARMMKSGLGCFAVSIGEVKIGAICAVNALGDIVDIHTGEVLAGLLAEDGRSLADTSAEMYSRIRSGNDVFESKTTTNTTLACVVTNAKLTKNEANRVAALAHDGFARAIRPVHTSSDGDAIFAMASGKTRADADIVAVLGADVISEAIKRAVLAAESAYGLKSARELKDAQI